nr:hypothetical protein [Tanacetum cinerariifolium]
MTSFDYRLNSRYAIKECSSCGTLYTRDCVCSKGNVEDQILVPKPPKHCAKCTRCGYLVDGPNCQGCALLRQELEENLVTHSQDAHISYNCPPTVPVSSNPEPCNNQTIDELPQTLPSFHPTFHSKAESLFTLDSVPTYVDESPNVFNPPPQPPVSAQQYSSQDHETNDIYYLMTSPFSAITPNEPVLSTEEPDNSLSMGDEHLDTILATESDDVIKYGVENLIPIPSESEGIPEHVCDVPSHDNSPPLNASPLDSELVSSEVMEIVIPEVEGIDDDIF